MASVEDEYGYCGGNVGLGTIEEDGKDVERPVNIEDARYTYILNPRHHRLLIFPP